MENKDYEKGNKRKEDIFSNAVRAGKRTYFFDVKATKGDDYYLTVTESKKKFTEEGKFHFEKHKLFLYKEDFEKFAEGLKDAIDFIQEKKGVYKGYQPEEATAEHHSEAKKNIDSEYSTGVNFDDLG